MDIIYTSYQRRFQGGRREPAAPPWASQGGAPRPPELSHPPEHFSHPQTPEPSAFYKFKFFKKINNIHHYRMILRCIIFLSIFL